MLAEWKECYDVVDGEIIRDAFDLLLAAWL